MRKQLIAYSNRYDCLAQVTLDWCEGILSIVGTEPNRTINVYGEVIAVEPKKEKRQIDLPDGMNSYKIATEGM